MNSNNNVVSILLSGLVAVAIIIGVRMLIGFEYNPSRWVFGEIGSRAATSPPPPNLPSYPQLPQQLAEKQPQPVIEHIGEKPKLAPGSLYQYKDKDGIVSFTDNPASIPKGTEAQARNWNGTLTGPKIEVKQGVSRETQIVVKDDQVFVPVKISSNGRENNLWLLLDTGATGITVYNNAVDGFYMANVRRGVSTLADGRRINNVTGTVESVSVGPAIVRNADITILPQAGSQNHQGLLGMRFLKNFHYTLDMGRQIIRWN